MYFIGKGGLLKKAVIYCLKNNIKVNGVFLVNKNDFNIFFLKKKKIKLFSNYKSFLKKIKFVESQIIFSINNHIILDNEILMTKNYFFNIHNALVQNCRGIAEICVYKAIITGEKYYGTTLHQLLPHGQVDTGPVVDQLKFKIKKNDTFKTLMTKSLNYCQKIFEKNIKIILNKNYILKKIKTSENIFNYNSLQCLKKNNQNTESFLKAENLGFYKFFFPKIKY